MYKFSDKILEGSGHKPLECRWGITVTHLYDTALECTKNHGECGFIHIFRLNASLLICLYSLVQIDAISPHDTVCVIGLGGGGGGIAFFSHTCLLCLGLNGSPATFVII